MLFKKIMYIAKNKDGVVNLFYKKPKQKDGYWLSQDGKYFTINSNSISMNWNDDPIEVVWSTNEEKQTLYDDGFKEGINETIKWVYQNLALDEPFPEKQLKEELLNGIIK